MAQPMSYLLFKLNLEMAYVSTFEKDWWVQEQYKKYLSNLLIEPYVGLNNLLNTPFNSNIRINAWGGRYFEPASEFSIYGGVSIRFE